MLATGDRDAGQVGGVGPGRCARSRDLVHLDPVTLPFVVKNSSQWWVVVVKTFVTTSSSFSVAPRTPLPPRPCRRNVSIGTAST